MMYQETELPTPHLDFSTVSRLGGLQKAVRPWSMPVPLRVMHTGFKDFGIQVAPSPKKTEAYGLPLRGTSTLLKRPEGFWLILTMTLPGGETPTGLFDGEPPNSRVDGGPCKGGVTATSRGGLYKADIKLTRPDLTAMTNQVLAQDPNSRILVRLLPRYGRGVLRWYPSHQCLQFWSAI